MPSKQLIEKVAQAIMHDEDTYRVGGEEYCETVARIAISTIFAALQEPSAAMVLAASEQVRIKSMWRAMLNASALGEKSYRAEIISADGAIWDETAPGSWNFKRREQGE